MTKDHLPATPAIRVLKARQVPFRLCPYRYEERGGTRVSARELGVDEHQVIKTLVFEDDRRQPFIVLMHGDRQVSAKTLARFLNVKTVVPCDPAVAERHTGYKVGGTSPFGMRKPLPLYWEETIAALPRIYINAGKRGLLAELAPTDLMKVLNPTAVHAAL
jgi:Cys-tRNA(Pro) deacylase